MNTREGFHRGDTHRITFEPVASRCTGACEAESCNCLRPRHLAPAEASTEIGSDEVSKATARFWLGYLALLGTMFGLWIAAGMGWL